VAAPPAREAPPAPVEEEPLTLELEPSPYPELALEDTAALRKRGVPVGTNPVSGYNPYDTGPPPPAGTRAAPDPAAPPRRTDLRKLSEWIRLQRQVEELKKTGGGEDSQ